MDRDVTIDKNPARSFFAIAIDIAVVWDSVSPSCFTVTHGAVQCFPTVRAPGVASIHHLLACVVLDGSLKCFAGQCWLCQMLAM